MYCRNCGNELDSGTAFCTKCGANQMNDAMNQQQINYQYLQNQNTQQQFYPQKQQMYIMPQEQYYPKKDSPLSLVSAIFGLLDFFFGFCAFVALIVGIIDLAMNNKTQRHLGSWVGIVFACIRFIFIGAIFNSYI